MPSNWEFGVDNGCYNDKSLAIVPVLVYKQRSIVFIRYTVLITATPRALALSTALPSAFISCIISSIHLPRYSKKKAQQKQAHLRSSPIPIPIKNINTPIPSTLKNLCSQSPLIGSSRSAIPHTARGPASANAESRAASAECRGPVANHGDSRDRSTSVQGRDIEAV